MLHNDRNQSNSSPFRTTAQNGSHASNSNSSSYAPSNRESVSRNPNRHQGFSCVQTSTKTNRVRLPGSQNVGPTFQIQDSQVQRASINRSPTLENSQLIPQTETLITSSSLSTNTDSIHVLLATAIITIYSKTGVPVQVRTVLDGGSQTSYVTEKLMYKLNLNTYNMQLQGFGV
ncbi:hypothetical protein JTB14_026939 [Gonioctena quinquepunctata]|nr:hypothetical protein JTB14_026939 [Gonioctena quinquepunctata]